jgi:hypothetical protein
MTILPNVLEARPTDTCFKYSPDAGTPECICSRCGNRIQAGEMPIRLTTTNKKGKVDKNSMEYRYCEECMTGKKFFACQMDIEFASRCDRQCEDCKLNPPQF